MCLFFSPPPLSLSFSLHFVLEYFSFGGLPFSVFLCLALFHSASLPLSLSLSISVFLSLDFSVFLHLFQGSRVVPDSLPWGVAQDVASHPSLQVQSPAVPWRAESPPLVSEELRLQDPNLPRSCCRPLFKPQLPQLCPSCVCFLYQAPRQSFCSLKQVFNHWSGPNRQFCCQRDWCQGAGVGWGEGP